MSDKRLDKLEAIGINSTADLLSYDYATLAVPTYKLLADNIDAARVDMHAGKYPFYPRGQSAPLIPRADIEIDFDVENDDEAADTDMMEPINNKPETENLAEENYDFSHEGETMIEEML